MSISRFYKHYVNIITTLIIELVSDSSSTYRARNRGNREWYT